MIVAILRNFNANTEVIGAVVQLLSLPFVLSVSNEDISEIKEVNVLCAMHSFGFIHQINIRIQFFPGLYSNEIITEFGVRFKNDLHCTRRQSNIFIIHVIFGSSQFDQQSRGSCIQVSNIDFILAPVYLDQNSTKMLFTIPEK